MSRRPVFIAELDANELAFRLMVIAIGLIPPPGTNAAAELTKAESNWPPGAGPFPFRRMSAAALEYFGQCVEAGSVPS